MTPAFEPIRPDNDGGGAGGLLRMLSVAVRRYSRDPETRAASARHMLAASINLYAAHTSAGEAALTASEVLSDMAVAERKRGGR